MARRTNFIMANSGVEQLKAVDFIGGNGWLQGDFVQSTYRPPWGVPDPSPEAFTIELYITNDGLGASNRFIWGMPLAPNGSVLRWFILQRNNNIRFGFIRSGGFLYRREYVVPNDGNFHHVVFTTDPNLPGGNRQRGYVDGVEITPASSAYVSSGIIEPAADPLYFNINGQSGAAGGWQGKLCYLAVYNNVFLNTAVNVAPYYSAVQDLDARRITKPLASIPKPDLFWCANDIIDLSLGWLESNSGIFLDTQAGLDNSDIILI